MTIDSNFRFDCHLPREKRCEGLQLPHSRPAPRAQPSDRRRRPDSHVQTLRLDYCNALLYGAPATTFDKLQRAQNNLARVVCHCRGRTDARPLFRSLHRLPVRQRVIIYKVALLTHKVRATATPAYLRDLVQIHVPTRALRSPDAAGRSPDTD